MYRTMKEWRNPATWLQRIYEKLHMFWSFKKKYSKYFPINFYAFFFFFEK